MPSLLGGVEKKVKSNVLLRRTLGMEIGNRYSSRKEERPDGLCALRDFVKEGGNLQLRTVRLRRNFRDPGQTPQFDREGKWKDKDFGSIYSPQTGEP